MKRSSKPRVPTGTYTDRDLMLQAIEIVRQCESEPGKVAPNVGAVIVKRPGQEVGANTLLHLCQTHLAGYKKPRSIEFRENLPMSAVGKILKREIREEYWVGRSRKI